MTSCLENWISQRGKKTTCWAFLKGTSESTALPCWLTCGCTSSLPAQRQTLHSCSPQHRGSASSPRLAAHWQEPWWRQQVPHRAETAPAGQTWLSWSTNPPKIQSFCWEGAPLLSYSLQPCVIVLQRDTGVRVISVLAGEAGINRAPEPVEWAVLQIHLLQTKASSSNDQIFKTEFTARSVYCFKEPSPRLWVSYVLWFIPRWPFWYNCSGNFGKNTIFSRAQATAEKEVWSWVARVGL